jgi:hypothetical protein
MATANIDGYLEGARDAFLRSQSFQALSPADRARAQSRFGSYERGYRTVLEAQARDSLEQPVGRLRLPGDRDGARGWNDALANQPPQSRFQSLMRPSH